jgi:hypothetical protein
MDMNYAHKYYFLRVNKVIILTIFQGDKMKKSITLTACLITGLIFSKSAASSPSPDVIMLACSAITANATDKLDPNVLRLTRNQFEHKVMGDCEWLIEGAHGDPKLASLGYKKVVKNFGEYIDRTIASPLTSSSERYILLNVFEQYKRAMSEVSHAAGDYTYLQQQADITKKGMNDMLGKN